LKAEPDFTKARSFFDGCSASHPIHAYQATPKSPEFFTIQSPKSASFRHLINGLLNIIKELLQDALPG